MKNGYFIIHRKIFNHWISERPDYFFAWMKIISMAEWKNTKTEIDGKPVTLKRGSFAISTRNLANELKMSHMVLRTFLEKLKKDGMIQLKSKRSITHVSVCKYETYQNKQHTSNTANNTADNTREPAPAKGSGDSITHEVTHEITHNKIEGINIKEISPEFLELSLRFHKHQKEAGYRHKDFKKDLTYETPVVIQGAIELDKLIRLDDVSMDQIRNVLRFALQDDFWKGQVISLAGIRVKSKNGNTKFFNIENDMKRKTPPEEKVNIINGVNG